MDPIFTGQQTTIGNKNCGIYILHAMTKFSDLIIRTVSSNLELSRIELEKFVSAAHADLNQPALIATVAEMERLVRPLSPMPEIYNDIINTVSTFDDDDQAISLHDTTAQTTSTTSSALCNVTSLLWKLLPSTNISNSSNSYQQHVVNVNPTINTL